MSGRCHVLSPTAATQRQWIAKVVKNKTSQPHITFTVSKWVLQGTFIQPGPNYHLPRVVLTFKPTVTHKARSIAHVQIKTRNTTCVDATRYHRSTRQSHQAKLVPSAFLSASSGTFNSLFKVLFIFPSWYLFAIGFEPIFSLRWNLPPILRSNPEERDS